MNCPKCQKQIPDTAKFCNHCGCNVKEALAEAQTALNNTNQVVADAIESGLAGINVQATVYVDGKEVGNVVTSTVSRNIAQAVMLRGKSFKPAIMP